MSVVEREFPEPGSADEYLDELKSHVTAAAEELKLCPTLELINRALQMHSMLQVGLLVFS